MDIEYWNDYYSRKTPPKDASSFAYFLNEHNFIGKGPILDIGCGNGRDSNFFQVNGNEVYALDQSVTAISAATELNPSINGLVGNVTDLISLLDTKVQNVYSRFSIHSMLIEEQAAFIKDIANVITSDGIVCIEARTNNDELCGQGTEGPDAGSFVTDHYRRFIDAEQLKQTLIDNGFKIVLFWVDINIAKLGNDNPEVVRIIARVK